MSIKGAEFSDLQPKNVQGALDIDFVTLLPAARDLEEGVIQQVTPNNAFRLGQQIFFWLGIANPKNEADDNFFTDIRLKLWWARPNMEFRQAGGGNGTLGAAAYLAIDTEVFAPGPLAGLADNRYVWIPSPKRLDVTQYQTPPPPVAVVRTSDSLLLDDVLKMDLRSPLNAAYIAQFPAPQVVSRWAAFFYPAMGYALGLTWDGVESNSQLGTPAARISLSWASGTLGGSNYQESVG